MMIRCLVVLSLVAMVFALSGQVKSVQQNPPSSSKSEINKNSIKVKLNESQDELMLNITIDNLIAKTEDSFYSSSAFNPNLGLYFLYDIPLGKKTGLSFAPGIGLTFSKINLSNSILYQDSLGTGFLNSKFHPDFFNRTSVTYDGSSFYTSWLEAPFELRYRSKPVNGRSSIKIAIGFRVGMRLAANSKVNYIDNSRRTDRTNIDKPYADLSSFRYGMTFRIGYGAINLFGYYGLNQLIKDSKNFNNEDLRQYSVGISITGM